jgi:hypothetical protein
MSPKATSDGRSSGWSARDRCSSPEVCCPAFRRRDYHFFIDGPSLVDRVRGSRRGSTARARRPLRGMEPAPRLGQRIFADTLGHDIDDDGCSCGPRPRRPSGLSRAGHDTAGPCRTGGLEGAELLATAGGFAALFLGLSNAYDNHGMRDFVLGATAGAIGGLILGGLLGSRPSRGERSSP